MQPTFEALNSIKGDDYDSQGTISRATQTACIQGISSIPAKTCQDTGVSTGFMILNL